MRFLVLTAIFLLSCSFVLADGLIAHSPKDNATIEPERDGFTFSVTNEYRDTFLKSCSLFIDGAEAKKLVINDKLGGASRRYSAQVGEGTYEWRISCETDKGELLSTPAYTVHVIRVLSSPVLVTSSGITRGSLLHSFTMQNVPDQPPVEVPEVKPGDSISITVNIPPSNMEREFFLKGAYTQNGQVYVRLNDRAENWDLYLRQNATLPITSSLKIIATLDSIQGKEGTFIFYPSVLPKQTEEPPSEEPDTPSEDQAHEEPEPEEMIEEPEQPPKEEPPRQEPPTPDPSPERPPEEKKGFFSWFLSLLAGIFGT